MSNKARIGDIVELKAQAWLLSNGYEVFRNVSSCGPADLIILKNNAFIPVDVKKVVDRSRKTKKVTQPGRNKRQQELDVQLLFYDEDKDLFAWSIAEIRQNRGLSAERPKAIPTPQLIISQGFKSMAEMARHYDVDPRAFRERIRTKKETPSQAIAALKQNRRRINVNGRIFRDRKDLCDHYNIPIRTFEYWTYDKGVSYEQAVKQLT